MVAEGPGKAVDHEAGHGGVDLSRQLDEAGLHPEFPGPPGQVEGIHRDTVPAQARPRIEGHVAEGLGGGGVDHLPDVDAHGVVDQLQLVHEGDVHRAEDVLGQLDGLGGGGAGDRHHPGDHGLVEGDGQGPGVGVVGTHHLGDGPGAKVRIAGVLALGREGQEDLAPDLQASGLQKGADHLVRGARPGRRLQDDQLARPQGSGGRGGAGADVGQVRVPVAGHRGRDADDDGVRLGKPAEVGGRRELTGVQGGPHQRRVQVVDDLPTGADGRNPGGIDVEAQHLEAGLHCSQGEGQAHIAKANDRNSPKRLTH